MNAVLALPRHPPHERVQAGFGAVGEIVGRVSPCVVAGIASGIPIVGFVFNAVL